MILLMDDPSIPVQMIIIIGCHRRVNAQMYILRRRQFQNFSKFYMMTMERRPSTCHFSEKLIDS
jgi:hypothetical protein